jgi:hypothetical protein
MKAIFRFATAAPVSVVLVWAATGIAQDPVASTSTGQHEKEREQVLGLLSELRTRPRTGDAAAAAETITIESTGESNDTASRTVLVVHKDGRFRQETTGVRTSLEGYDGQVCWQRDATGLAKSLALSDREHLLLLTQLRSGRWLDLADPDSLSVVDGGVTDRSVTFEVRSGRAVSQITVARDSGDPTRCAFCGTLGPATWDFSDYQDHFGWSLPMSVHMTDSVAQDTVSVVSVRAAAPDQRVEFGKPASIRGDVTFAPGEAAQLQLTRAKTGHVLVEVNLDDEQPHTFVFDTGAGGTLLDQRLSETLHLPSVGSQRVAGVYTTEAANMVVGRKLQVGGVTLNKPHYIAMNLDYIRQLMGQDGIVGVIGYDLISQCVCEIDLASNRIRLTDPANAPEQLPWQAIAFHQNIPLVPATFPQGHGLFRIDVGASSGEAGNVIFHSPAVNQYRLVSQHAPRATVGNVEYAPGTIAWFELMGHRFEQPRVIYSLARSGPFADPFVDGNIGVEFLKPFRIVLDYQHERLAFLPVETR